MTPTSTDLRTANLQHFLDAEHFRFRRNPAATLNPSEVEVTASWSTRLLAAETPLLRQMMQDFREFCRQCCDVTLAAETTEPTTFQIVWELTTPPPAHFDRQDKSIESFEIISSAEQLLIRASHERGLLHATHYIEWLTADRGGPFLQLGTQAKQPAFMPRISNGVFLPGYQKLTDIGRFSDEYLSLMSHFGANGIHIYLDLWSVFQSSTLPELNASDAAEQIAALRAFNQRTLKFGIDVYLHVNTPGLDESHPVFQAHPEAKGARIEIFIEEISGRPWHNLCSGSPKVLAAYSEALTHLYTTAPELAGMMMIIGGECFFHCYTRPADCDNGDTNCPRCHGKSASLEVAHLVNTAASAVKSTGAHKSFYAWPYSAFIWSSQDPAEIEMIKHFDESVSLLSNFDCGDSEEHGVVFFDYNITCIGPSKTFARQAATRFAQGRPIFTKIETCTTADAFFLPHLPLYQRWYDRVASIKNTGVSGFVGQWRFFGMNGSPPEEIQYKANWDNLSSDDMLRTRAMRDFRLDASTADQVVESWSHLSRAWDSYPYSSMTAGERAAYMRGPFYLGPAHPLIFDVQDRYNLPEVFFALRGDLAEMETSKEELEELLRKAKPRYVSDLLVTLPYGVERYLELLKQTLSHWNQGLTGLRRILGSIDGRAAMELGICEAMGIHLQSLENVVRFYQARDVLQNTPTSLDKFHAGIADLQQIITEEIANSERMLPLITADPRIGYGHTYGPVYDAAMIEAKIVQCRYVRDIELPRFSKVIRFHIWNESP